MKFGKSLEGIKQICYRNIDASLALYATFDAIKELDMNFKLEQKMKMGKKLANLREIKGLENDQEKIYFEKKHLGDQ